jgi:hypothetical protein
MARIRTIKPEFWTDRKIVGLSPYARLLFVGSWNFAMCDDGHLVDDTFALKLQVLPIDAVDIDQLVSELITAEVMTRGVTSDGRGYLHVPKLREHQKVDGRWVPRCYVCADQRLAETPASSTELTETRARLGESQPSSPKLAQTRPGKERKVITTTSGTPDEPPGFAEFYAAYPRKEARRDAVKAYRETIKRTDHETIMAGLARFPFPSERQYQPLPASFLRKDRWADHVSAGSNGHSVLEVDNRPEPMTGEQIKAARAAEWQRTQEMIARLDAKAGQR